MRVSAQVTISKDDELPSIIDLGRHVFISHDFLILSIEGATREEVERIAAAISAPILRQRAEKEAA